MTSNPILTARPSAARLVSPKVGTGKVPVKSILREPSARTVEFSQRLLKRKMDDRYESDQENDTKKRRRVSGSDNEEEDGEADKDDNNDEEENDEDSDVDDAVDAESNPKTNGVSQNGAPVAKHQKTVHFDMNLNITTEVGRRTLEETKLSVRRALESHAIATSRPSHDDQAYMELVDVFSHDTDAYQDPLDSGDDDEDDEGGNTVQPDDLVLYVVALTSCTPLLNKSCINLVRKLLACSWIGRDDKFFRAYVQCTS